MGGLWIIAGFVAGFVMIIKGGDVFVDAALYIARKMKIPTAIMGATIVSLTTTLPELLVSSMAAATGHSEMAIGNAIGSIICNTGLILGLCLILTKTVHSDLFALKKSLLLLTTIVVYGLLVWLNHGLGKVSALVLYALLGGFVWLNLMELNGGQEEDTGGEEPFQLMQVPKFILGAALIVIGARLLVDNGSALAVLMGVPEKVISLSLIAFGTSLPELVTSITAIIKKENALSLGNIIGANVLNITLVLSTATMVSSTGMLPLIRTETGRLAGQYQLFLLDIPVAMAVCIILAAGVWRRKLTRVHGVVLMGTYIIYLLILLFTMG